MIGATLLVVGILVIAVWVILEAKRFKHRVVGFLVIGGILFFYVTGYFVLKGVNLDYGSISGLVEATKLYFGWLFSVGENFMEITGNVINMDWKGNKN